MFDHASVIAAAVLFSFYGILIKKTNTDIWLLVCIKLTLGLALSAAFASIEHDTWQRPSLKDVSRLSLPYAYSVIALTISFHLGSVAFVLPLFFTYPVIAVLFHIAKNKQKFTSEIAASGVFSVVALLCLFCAESYRGGSSTVKYLPFMLAISAAAAVGYRLSVLKDDSIDQRYTPNQKMLLQTLVGGILTFCVLLYFAFGSNTPFLVRFNDIQDWFAYLPCTAWAIPVLLLYGMQTIPLLNVAAYAYVEVIAGMVLSYILLRSEWPNMHVVGFRIIAALCLGAAVMFANA